MTESWPPEFAQELVSFDVSGDPKGAGSKDAIPLGRWGKIQDVHEAAVFKREIGTKWFRAIWRDSGIPIVNVVDSSGKAGEAWRAEIQAACAGALDAAHELTDEPIAVRVIFYGESPKARYGTGRNATTLKDTADRLPHRSALPDGTKLARALEDALNALCWTDDRRVCDLWWSRRFGVHPGARVVIYRMPARFCDEPEQAQGDQLVIMET